ncbi:hypothetical protein RKD18_001103 [Streptomyces phaeoluteigriseus]
MAWVNRTSAASDASGRPLRTPASTSSTSPQLAATRSCGQALARWAASNASSYLPRPLRSTAPARCATATPRPSPRWRASSILASIKGAASLGCPRQAASVIVPYGAKLLPTASWTWSISAMSSAAASSSPAHVWTTTCELSASGSSISAPTARAVRTWRVTSSVQPSKSHISAASVEASHDQRRTSSGSASRRNASTAARETATASWSPAVKRVARASRSRSAFVGGLAWDVVVLCAAAATSRTFASDARRPANMAADSVSRKVSRASATSSGTIRCAVTSSFGRASSMRVDARDI